MKQTHDELIRSLAGDEEQRLAEHPSPEMLVAYHRKQLSLQDRELLQEHLTFCRECSALLLDLVEMLDGSTTEEHEADGAAAWPEMLERLPQEEVGSGVEDELPSAAYLDAHTRGSSLRFASVAALVVAVIGLFLWNLQLQNRVRSLSAPRLNVLVHDLGDKSLFRAETSGEAELIESGKTDDLLLILTPETVPDQPSYRVRVVDEAGSELWAGAGLRPTPVGNFTLLLSRSVFSGDSYQIELFSEASSTGEPLDYRFEIRFSDP